MQLEVLTPDKLLYRGEVDYVQMPGINGSFGVLNNHAPLISALGKGMVKVDQVKAGSAYDAFSGEYAETKAQSKVFEFEINGGVVEVLKNKIIILAE